MPGRHTVKKKAIDFVQGWGKRRQAAWRRAWCFQAQCAHIRRIGRFLQVPTSLVISFVM
jgi:hypothetical protein